MLKGFYIYKLLPAWLSMWGIIALLLHLIAQFYVIFGGESISTMSILLNIPIALQEMVMAIYLIRFGFKEKVY